MADTPAGLLQREREETRRLLADGYAEDHIDQDELERRLELAEHAGSIAELRALTVELRPIEPAPGQATALVPVRASEPQRLPVLFSSVERVGAWSVPARMQVRATFGAVVLDLRQAVLPADTREIEIDARVIFASLEIVVPPGWSVDNRCGAVLGSVEQDACEVDPSQEFRVLRLSGRVVFGSLAVYQRLPGEDYWAARQRTERALAERGGAERGGRALPRGDG